MDQSTGLLRLDDTFESTDDGTPEKKLNILTSIMEHGLQTSLGSVNLNSNDHPLLLVEKSYTPPNQRSKLTEIIFEEYNIPSYFLCRDAVLSCYACGRTTSTVVDVGHYGTVVTPVFDGFVEQKGILNSPIGGNAMDHYFLQLLETTYKEQQQKEIIPFYQVHSNSNKVRNPDFHKLCKLDVAQSIKETITLTANKLPGYDPLEANSSYTNMIRTPMELPDGSVVQVGHERYAPTELLFSANCQVFTNKREEITIKANKKQQQRDDEYYYMSSVVSNSNPIQNMVCDSVFLCDREQQAQLLGNIVLTGGGSNIPNISDRLRDEVEGIIHKHTPGWRVKVISPGLGGNVNSTGNTSTPAVQYNTVNTSNISAWLGGSILGSLGSFQEMYLTKKEYEEFGSHYVNRKCP